MAMPGGCWGGGHLLVANLFVPETLRNALKMKRFFVKFTHYSGVNLIRVAMGYE